MTAGSQGGQPPLVAHVIVGLNLGGAEMMLARLAEASRDAGKFRHVVISLTTVGTIGARLQSAGIPVHALHFSNPLNSLAGFWRLRALLKFLRPDVVQTWMYHADLLGGLAAYSAGFPNIVWGVRTTYLNFEGSMFTRVVAKVCALLSRSIPRVIVCAAEASRHVHQHMGYDVARMKVIPNGFDIQRLKPKIPDRESRRAKLGILDDATLLIGAVGRFSPVKDFQNFIDACGVVARNTKQTSFVLIGRGLDRDNALLMSWLSDPVLRERFNLLGELDDIPEWLSALDIFCLSSKSEGFPNVVGEAMASAVPCVVTDVGDAAALVGATGEVVSSQDSSALGAALLKVVRLPVEERRALGYLARARIVAEYSLTSTLGKYEALYSQLISGGREVH